MTSDLARGSRPATLPEPVVTETSIQRRYGIPPHHCFACGSLNVNGLQLDLHAQGDRCWTDLTLDRRFQGWDGIAHGGILCTILDEVMAWSLIERDHWGLTARLRVDFKRPVPIGRPLHAEGRVVEARRRLVTTDARLVDADTDEVLATAEATYVAADEDRKRELKARYGFSGPGGPAR